jgi:3-hydroxyisobutyrate dehydrogenase-like beta-hydroxyacid dehydrogenase
MASTESLIGVADAAINTAKELDMSAKLFEDMKELYVKALEKGYGSKDASSITEVLLDTK